jgi:hypothetical protein
MTSEELARVYEQAKTRWMTCALRRRLADPAWDSIWRTRYCVRAVTLLQRWRTSDRLPLGTVLTQEHLVEVWSHNETVRRAEHARAQARADAKRKRTLAARAKGQRR